MKGILGIKLGMTEAFTESGKSVPVTAIEVMPNVISQIKTKETDGYSSIQLGLVDKKEKRSTKAEKGHFEKASTTPKRFLKEIRVENTSDYELGQEVKADIFEIGEMVDVTGTSKGKGFQGVIKRYNQARGPMGHGSHYHRGVGSMGPMRPMRVLPGKHLPGHMGDETVTIQNLEIISIDMEENVVLVKGNVPGIRGGLVVIKSAVKRPSVVKESEALMSYEVEETPVVEESAETVEETNETTPSNEEDKNE